MIWHKSWKLETGMFIPLYPARLFKFIEARS
jgi:hypothetical protein